MSKIPMVALKTSGLVYGGRRIKQGREFMVRTKDEARILRATKCADFAPLPQPAPPADEPAALAQPGPQAQPAAAPAEPPAEQDATSPAQADAPKPRRHYRRRDMQAEPSAE